VGSFPRRHGRRTLHSRQQGCFRGRELRRQFRRGNLASDASNQVVSHKFINQFQTEADVEKIRTPEVNHDEAETARRLEVAEKLFGGLLDLRPDGVDPYLGTWDVISTWMSVEGALYGLIDKPDMMHQIVERITTGYMSMLDQLEEQGLLCGP